MYDAIKKLFSSLLALASLHASGQMAARLNDAYNIFQSDSQLRSAISSLYVIDARTGEVVFDKNSATGLAPASTQKIITAATFYALLGKDFRYKTYIGYDIGIRNNELLGNLYIEGSGDPTLGSERWRSTRDSAVMKKISVALQKNGIRKIKGDIWIDDLKFGINPVPDGWIWQDIGNYYGAGSWGLNWQENQFDLVFKPSSYVGGKAEVVRTKPELYQYRIGNLMKTGEKGSGDNGYIYYAPFSNYGFATGTIPQGANEFTISGSVPQPARQFGFVLSKQLALLKIPFSNKVKLYTDLLLEGTSVRKAMLLLDSIVSPDFDSINYFFLRKSINLYGESLLHTLSWEKFLPAHSEVRGSTEDGVAVVKEFWKSKGIAPTELNMADGSGLSPLNRVTTHAQVSILQYARKQEWFNGFYDALPVYNGMKMKSGTINGVKGFCGYQVSKDGHEYIFSFLVNNYNGSASAVVQKMYKVLEELK